MVSPMTLLKRIRNDVNRYIWFDFEPISYRSYGWKSIHPREMSKKEIIQIHDLRKMTEVKGRRNEGIMRIRLFLKEGYIHSIPSIACHPDSMDILNK